MEVEPYENEPLRSESSNDEDYEDPLYTRPYTLLNINTMSIEELIATIHRHGALEIREKWVEAEGVR